MEQHNDAVLAFGLFALSGLFGMLWWFIRTKVASYDLQHQKHFEHASDMNLHETDRERELQNEERRSIAMQLKEHNDRDDMRFDRMENTFSEIRNDIKEILKAVNHSS